MNNSKIEIIVSLSIVVVFFSIGYWSYILLEENPSMIAAQLIGGGTVIVGSLICLGIIKLVEKWTF